VNQAIVLDGKSPIQWDRLRPGSRPVGKREDGHSEMLASPIWFASSHRIGLHRSSPYRCSGHSIGWSSRVPCIENGPVPCPAMCVKVSSSALSFSVMQNGCASKRQHYLKKTDKIFLAMTRNGTLRRLPATEVLISSGARAREG
jgi:hypothetical protein